MPTSASYQVYGIQEALAEINKVDRLLRRQITKDIVNALVSLAKKPTTEPGAPVPTIVNENYLDQRES